MVVFLTLMIASASWERWNDDDEDDFAAQILFAVAEYSYVLLGAITMSWTNVVNREIFERFDMSNALDFQLFSFYRTCELLCGDRTDESNI